MTGFHDNKIDWPVVTVAVHFPSSHFDGAVPVCEGVGTGGREVGYLSGSKQDGRPTAEYMGEALKSRELWLRLDPAEMRRLVVEYERGQVAEGGAPPTRSGPLPEMVRKAARKIHQKVWRGPYVEGEGPMHYAGGSYWHNELLRLADEWEKLAVAARICAGYLPNLHNRDTKDPTS